ncbi:hypothetical protein D3C87_107720 [compost metagenome]
MKRILLLMILSCFTAVGFAQTLVDGDYRTAKISGNWSDADMWERRSGGTWAITATSPTASNNVYVQNGHTVTVDVANVYCKDLQLNTAGSLVIGTNVANVSGKIRAFTNAAVTGSADGNYSTSTATLVSSMIVTNGVGVLKFVGGTRTIAAAGEWNSATTSNAVEFALDVNATGTIVPGVKFRPIVISSGTILTDGLFSAGSGDFTIKSGAVFRSTRSGSVIWNSSTTKIATLTIESGATMELSGGSPTIDATTIINNGTITYNSSSSQNLITRSSTNTDASAVFENYYDLKFSNAGTRQLPAFNIKVAHGLYTDGTTAISNTTNSTKITMANNSTIYRSSTGNISSTAIEFGSSSSDVVNISIGAVLSVGGEMVSSPAPGTIGDLTILNTGAYTVGSSRAVNNLINNGILILSPSTSMTFTVNGNVSGIGTISGHVSASLTLAGANSGDAGMLKFTAGQEQLNNLTISRSGTGASVTLQSSLTLNGNLNLTSGLVNIQPGQRLAVSSINSISGSPFSSSKYINTQSSGGSVGKFVITDLAASRLIPLGYNGNYLPVTLNPTASSTFDINVFAGTTTDATPNGTALTAAQKSKMVDATWNIQRTSGTGNVDVTLGWDSALEGVDFANFTDAQIGVSAYNGGTYTAFTSSGNAAANTATFTTSSFSPFVVGEANTTLPLTLISFTPKQVLNSVKLEWRTTDEVNLKNYVLQHKVGNDFKDIYTVSANNKLGTFNYTYTHLNPAAGVNYYRLVGVDLDGTTHESEVKSIRVTLGSEVAVYPNPVSQRNITVSGVVKGDVIKILNIQGQIISTKVTNGNPVEEIDVQSIQAGTYILSIENGGKITSTKKVIKI